MDTMKDTKMQPAKDAVIEEQRTLLNLAAKAAGYKVHGSGKLFWIWKDSNVEWVDWNPLTDDGDALRLAVKLGIEMLFTKNRVGAGRHSSASAPLAAEDRNTDDPYAATRRAIVRAAAEIGRNMK